MLLQQLQYLNYLFVFPTFCLCFSLHINLFLLWHLESSLVTCIGVADPKGSQWRSMFFILIIINSCKKKKKKQKLVARAAPHAVAQVCGVLQQSSGRGCGPEALSCSMWHVACGMRAGPRGPGRGEGACAPSRQAGESTAVLWSYRDPSCESSHRAAIPVAPLSLWRRGQPCLHLSPAGGSRDWEKCVTLSHLLAEGPFLPLASRKGHYRGRRASPSSVPPCTP